MGITLGTKRKDVSMGYASFYRFRLEIAKAYSTDFYSKLNAYWLNVMRFFYIEPHVERLDCSPCRSWIGCGPWALP